MGPCSYNRKRGQIRLANSSGLPTNVANISSEFATDFNASEFAYAGGLLHDIGKYSPEFQKRLEGNYGRVDYSTAGAREAESLYPFPMSRFLEYIVAGHHGGIPDYGTNVNGLKKRIRSAAA